MKSRRDNNKMTIILITLIIFTLMFSIFSILSSIMESYLAVYNYAFVGNHIGI